MSRILYFGILASLDYKFSLIMVVFSLLRWEELTPLVNTENVKEQNGGKIITYLFRNADYGNYGYDGRH